MLNAVCVGLGLFAPIGEIGQITTSGNEIVISCEYGAVARSSLATSFELLSFSKNEWSINTYHTAQKVRFRVVKKINLSVGLGWYFIEEKLNNVIDKDRGVYSSVGLWLPFDIGNKGLLSYEILYSTVPRGTSMNISLGFRL